MNNDNNEYLKTCFFTDKLFNEYFDNYIFRKNVLETMNLDVNTQNNNKYNKISILHMNEYLKTCFFADKLFNEYFDNYIFRKNVLEIMNLDINTQNKNEYNEISMLHHIYIFIKSYV